MVDSSDADKSLQKTDKNVVGLGEKFGNGIKTVAKWGAALGAAATVGAAALFGVATKSAEAADRIDKLSQKIGLSRKGFQEWDFIASQSGMSVEVLQSGFKTLSGIMVDASEGGTLATKAFADLGVSVEDSTGNLKSQEQMFNETIMALQGMEEGPKKAALANDLLGKSASELAPLINGASGSIEEMRKKANDLGLVLSDETVDAGVKFTDSIDQAKRSMGAMVTNIGASVMPMFQSMLDWIMAHLPEIQSTFKVVFDTISSLVIGVSGFIGNTLIPILLSLYNWVSPNIPIIQEIFKIAFEIMKTAIDSVITVTKSIIDWVVKYQDILVALSAGITAATIVFGIYTLAINAVAIATGIWATITGIATVVGGAFAAVIAFITSPIGLVVIAIGLLVAAGILLYKNWDTVKAVAMNVFGAIGSFIGGIIDGIKGGFKGMVNGVISGLNFMVNALNKLKFTVPDWVPLIGGKGFGFNIPNIPSFAVGSRSLPRDMLINAHEGEMIVPKKENPYENSGGEILPTNGRNNKQPITLQLVLQNGKVIAEYLIDDIDNLMGGKNKATARSVGI
jgi:hypothetical protein